LVTNVLKRAIRLAHIGYPAGFKYLWLEPDETIEGLLNMKPGFLSLCAIMLLWGHWWNGYHRYKSSRFGKAMFWSGTSWIVFPLYQNHWL